MLDLSDLECYCYSGVWNAGLLWREWVQCSDRRHLKNQKTDRKCEENQEKNKQSTKTWLLTRMASNFKQKALKKAEDEPHKLQRNSGTCDAEEDPVFENCMSQLSIPILPESSLHIPLENLALPCGTFTEIQNAELSHSHITIKRENSNNKHIGLNILRKELCVLSQVHHPNILLLMGVVKMDLNDIVTIFEEASNGTLHHLLHQKKILLSAMERRKLLTELCHVMVFLHDRGWLHTAITSHTILITANFTLKLTGFERARQLNVTQIENSTSKYLRKQWFHWQSPEQLNGHKTSTETDIFSAGLVAWEMFTNAEPWLGYTYDELLIKYESLKCALETEGLSFPAGRKNVASFLSCMQHMLQIDPKKRIPCFLHVLSQVHKIQATSLATVSDHIQPTHFAGTLERAQLLFQPQPQKAMFASNTQKNHLDRDPYTGLKRVSNSLQKLHIKSPSTTNLDTVNICSTSFSNSGKETNKSQKVRKHSINKLQVKNEFSMQHTYGNALHNKIQNHNAHLPQSMTLDHEVKKINPDVHSSQLGAQRKCNSQPSHNALFTPETENRFSRTVPIKPASHLNQRTINFKHNCTKSISKEQSIQHRNVLWRKLSNGNISYDTSKWETSTPKQHYRMRFGESKKEVAEKQTFATPHMITENAYAKSVHSAMQSGDEYRKFSHQSERKYIKNNAGAQESHYMDHRHLNSFQYSNETETQYQKGHEISHSDLESKENGFESTDSGIFTISRDFDSVLHQVNSTEDLYIDDEFCLEMELDSHMQLLCLFESTSEYDNHFLDDLSSDFTEDKNMS